MILSLNIYQKDVCIFSSYVLSIQKKNLFENLDACILALKTTYPSLTSERYVPMTLSSNFCIHAWFTILIISVMKVCLCEYTPFLWKAIQYYRVTQ